MRRKKMMKDRSTNETYGHKDHVHDVDVDVHHDDDHGP